MIPSSGTSERRVVRAMTEHKGVDRRAADAQRIDRSRWCSVKERSLLVPRVTLIPKL